MEASTSASHDEPWNHDLMRKLSEDEREQLLSLLRRVSATNPVR